MKQLRSRKTGFTLLELIIALTILGLMAGMVFSSLRLAMNSYEKSQERIREAAVRRVLLSQLKKQVGSLFPLTPTIQVGNQQNMQYDPTMQEYLSSSAPLFYGAENFVVFLTVSPLILEQNPGLTVVRYGLAQNEFGDEYLGAMEVPYSSFEAFISLIEDPSGEPLAIVEDVEYLEFQYYGYDAQGQYFDWFSYWSGQELMAVPEALRILYNESSVVVPINATSFNNGLNAGIRALVAAPGGQ